VGNRLKRGGGERVGVSFRVRRGRETHPTLEEVTETKMREKMREKKERRAQKEAGNANSKSK